VMYGQAGVNGAPAAGLGMAIVNALDDPPRGEAALTKLSAAIVRRTANGQFTLTARDQQIGGVTVHTLIMPQAQPSWAVHNGKLYLALSPQGVAAAAKASENAGGGNIAHNDRFAALLQRLGAPRMSGFEFADLPLTAAAMYPALQGGIVGLGMIAAQQGIWVPGDLLPPLDRIRPHLAPGGSVSWVDATGWHSRGITPFPGSDLLSGQQAGTTATVGVTALGVSILLPSLNRARETANRVKCASNERQIGQAILLYSNDHRGKYPPDLGELITNPGTIPPELAQVGGVQAITLEVFTCPSSDNDVPSSIEHAAKPAQAKWVNENSSYVYVGQGKTNQGGEDDLVLYEKEGDHDQDGLNMLFADGSVLWEPMAEARQIIASKRRPHEKAPQQRPQH